MKRLTNRHSDHLSNRAFMICARFQKVLKKLMEKDGCAGDSACGCGGRSAVSSVPGEVRHRLEAETDDRTPWCTHTPPTGKAPS